MTPEEEHERLAARLAAAGDHATAAAAATARVETWKWAKGGAAHAREPFGAERAGVSEPPLKAGRAPEGRGVREYGFDSAGHMVVARVFGSSGSLMAEEFLCHEDGRVWSLRYESGPEGDWGPTFARLQQHGPDGMTSSSSFHPTYGHWREVYVYRDGRVVEIRERPGRPFAEGALECVFTIVYGADGGAEHIASDGHVVWRRRRRGPVPARLARAVEDALTIDIRRALSSAERASAPWLVLMRAQDDGPVEDQFALSVSVAAAADRERLQKEVQAERYWQAGWDVSAWAVPDLPWTPTDRVRDAVREAAAVLSPTDGAAIQAILDRVAGRLATDPHVGSNVAVAACDFDLERLEDGLERATPASRLDALRELGLLPDR